MIGKSKEGRPKLDSQGTKGRSENKFNVHTRLMLTQNIAARLWWALVQVELSLAHFQRYGCLAGPSLVRLVNWVVNLYLYHDKAAMSRFYVNGSPQLTSKSECWTMAELQPQILILLHIILMLPQVVLSILTQLFKSAYVLNQKLDLLWPAGHQTSWTIEVFLMSDASCIMVISCIIKVLPRRDMSARCSARLLPHPKHS